MGVPITDHRRFTEPHAEVVSPSVELRLGGQFVEASP
jgi:hypothetical protein